MFTNSRTLLFLGGIFFYKKNQTAIEITIVFHILTSSQKKK